MVSIEREKKEGCSFTERIKNSLVLKLKGFKVLFN